MRMVKALDAGPMIAVESVSIGRDDTSVELEERLSRVGAALLARSLDGLAANRAHEIPQDDLAATYAPRLTKDDGRIDWSRPAVHPQCDSGPAPLAARGDLRRHGQVDSSSIASGCRIVDEHAGNGSGGVRRSPGCGDW